MLRAVALLALLSVAASCGMAAAEPRPPATSSPAIPAAAGPGIKTIIIVRHAEAASTKHGGDPVLSDDGRTRALELARVLADTQLRTVYTTHLQRSRMTAEPLPRRAGEKPTVIDEVPAILAALRAEPWGATALVVGHSNTVPELVRGLTGQELPRDEPIVYDRMWVVTLTRDGGASLLRLHYGAPVAVQN